MSSIFQTKKQRKNLMNFCPRIYEVVQSQRRHFIMLNSRRFVGCVNQTESQATWSKFHGESYDNLFIFTTVTTQCFVHHLRWHISLEFWFIYLNFFCYICKACIQVWTSDGVSSWQSSKLRLSWLQRRLIHSSCHVELSNKKITTESSRKS